MREKYSLSIKILKKMLWDKSSLSTKHDRRQWRTFGRHSRKRLGDALCTAETSKSTQTQEDQLQ